MPHSSFSDLFRPFFASACCVTALGLAPLVACGGTSQSGAAGGAGSGTAHAGANSSGDGSCAQLTTLDACQARSGCQAIYRTLQCPGSGAPCPTVFTYCSNTG